MISNLKRFPHQERPFVVVEGDRLEATLSGLAIFGKRTLNIFLNSDSRLILVTARPLRPIRSTWRGWCVVLIDLRAGVVDNLCPLRDLGFDERNEFLTSDRRGGNTLFREALLKVGRCERLHHHGV
jgi:hypothetical protein